MKLKNYKKQCNPVRKRDITKLNNLIRKHRLLIRKSMRKGDIPDAVYHSAIVSSYNLRKYILEIVER